MTGNRITARILLAITVSILVCMATLGNDFEEPLFKNVLGGGFQYFGDVPFATVQLVAGQAGFMFCYGLPGLSFDIGVASLAVENLWAMSIQAYFTPVGTPLRPYLGGGLIIQQGSWSFLWWGSSFASTALYVFGGLELSLSSRDIPVAFFAGFNYCPKSTLVFLDDLSYHAGVRVDLLRWDWVGEKSN